MRNLINRLEEVSEDKQKLRSLQDDAQRAFKRVDLFQDGDYGLHGGPYKYAAIFPEQNFMKKAFPNANGGIHVVAYIREDGSYVTVSADQVTVGRERQKNFVGYGKRLWVSDAPEVVIKALYRISREVTNW
jgi:hypothetical protein